MADIVDRAQTLIETRDADDVARGIRAAQAAIAGNGGDDCTDCGEPIEPNRRTILPSATRCSCCQHDHDHAKRITLSGGRGFFDPAHFNRSHRP